MVTTDLSTAGELAQQLRVDSVRSSTSAGFPEVRVASFSCWSHGNAADTRLGDHLYLVFSQPPDGMANSEFAGWYREHAEENTRVPGFRANWRYRLEPSANIAPHTPATHLAMYEVDQDLATLQANLRVAAAVNRAGWPAWFDPTPWTSFDAVALGAGPGV